MISGAIEGQENHQYSAFEMEFNQLVRKHFPHWGARDLNKLG